MKLILILALIQFYIIKCNDWHDPHEMISSVKSKLHEKLKKSGSTSDLPSCAEVQPPNLNTYSIHFQRIIGLIFKAASIDKSDPTLFHGHLMFDITPSDLNFLLNINTEDLNIDTLHRVDTIFSESFTKSLVELYLENLMTAQSKLYATIVNIHNLWLLGICFMLYVVYQLFRTNFSFTYIFKYLIIVVFVVDFGLRYKLLFEEAEEHNLNVQYSPLCDTQKMSWNDYFKFVTSSRDCERRTVTPLDAFLYQLKNVIIVPMNAFGTGMGGFVVNMYAQTPWGFGLLLLPCMLIFSFAIIVFLMAFMTDKSIEFNFFHLLKLKFGSPGSRESMLTGKTVERLIDRVLHRPMVQDVGAAGDPGTMRQMEGPGEGTSSDKCKSSTPANQEESNSRARVASSSHLESIVSTKEPETSCIQNLNHDLKLKDNQSTKSSEIKKHHSGSAKRDTKENQSEIDKIMSHNKKINSNEVQPCTSTLTEELLRETASNVDSKDTLAKMDANTNTHLEEVVEKGTQTQFIKYD